jgi:hypothetical protein
MMGAREITAALGGRWCGGYGVACCPGHDDRTPSLSISDGEDGKILVKCHAGCEQRAIITALQDLRLWPQLGKESGPLTAAEKDQRRQEHAEQGREQNAKSQAALAIWGASVPAAGTLVETYLASRRLHLPPLTSLRFHPGLTHPSGGSWPAMVALVTRGSDDAPIAVHRTFLARDGSGKAPVEPQRMMLGLAGAASELLVGEGLETVLSGMEATGKPGWACLSTGGLRSLHLPKEVREVIILEDADDPGREAAAAAAERLACEGRSVRVARPPAGFKDFNDVLLEGVACRSHSPRHARGGAETLSTRCHDH